MHPCASPTPHKHPPALEAGTADPAPQAGPEPEDTTMTTTAPIARRAFLGLGLAAGGAALLSACTADASLVAPSDGAVRLAEQARRSTGRTRELVLTAAPSSIDLGGRSASTWSFGTVPATPIRITAGDRLRATLRNRLPEPTSIHWHGVALRNDMDGVPAVTQTAVQPGGRFTYDFIAEHPGTYWFHPHVGVQLDRGLSGALVVEDPKESLRYDREWVVVLDDWLDTTPEAVLAQLSKGMGAMSGSGSMDGMSGMLMRDGDMLMGTSSRLLGGDTGDVYYPRYLVNGRPAVDPETFRARPGDRIRIRLINAGGDTAFRVALGGHTMTVTHSDGYPVEPSRVDSVLIGMGERYDVVVTAGSGVFPLVAAAEGKRDGAFALLRTTATGIAPRPLVTLPELAGRVGRASMLRAADEVRLPAHRVDRTIRLTLTGGMARYDWAINGRAYDTGDPLRGASEVRQGERVRLQLVNRTAMWHPMHLHGHTYQHAGDGPRKDTSVVLPGQTLTVEFDADNPGRWLAHCHNVYHAESGMMTVLAYRA